MTKCRANQTDSFGSDQLRVRATHQPTHTHSNRKKREWDIETTFLWNVTNYVNNLFKMSLIFFNTHYRVRLYAQCPNASICWCWFGFVSISYCCQNSSFFLLSIEWFDGFTHSKFPFAPPAPQIIISRICRAYNNISIIFFLQDETRISKCERAAKITQKCRI